MALRRGTRTNLLTPRENELAHGTYENTGLDLRFLGDSSAMAEGASSRADSQASLTSSVAKKRVFPGDYQRRLPGLVMTDFGDFLQTCLKVGLPYLRSSGITELL